MTEDHRCKIAKNEHCALHKFIFWGPITQEAYIDYSFHTGRGDGHRFTEAEMTEIEKRQQSIPVHMFYGYWYYQGKFYRHTEQIDDPVVAKGFIIQLQRRKAASIEKARRVGQGHE